MERESERALASSELEPLALGSRGAECIGTAPCHHALRDVSPGDVRFDTVGKGLDGVAHTRAMTGDASTAANRHSVETFSSVLQDNSDEEAFLQISLLAN